MSGLNGVHALLRVALDKLQEAGNVLAQITNALGIAGKHLLAHSQPAQAGNSGVSGAHAVLLVAQECKLKQGRACMAPNVRGMVFQKGAVPCQNAMNLDTHLNVSGFAGLSGLLAAAAVGMAWQLKGELALVKMAADPCALVKGKR